METVYHNDPLYLNILNSTDKYKMAKAIETCINIRGNTTYELFKARIDYVLKDPKEEQNIEPIRQDVNRQAPTHWELKYITMQPSLKPRKDTI